MRCKQGRLGASLEQKQNNTKQPISHARRFWNKNEQRYSINELELLTVVRSLEHFKNYLFGSHFTLQTDHQALLSALKNNRGNETYQSRLTRWVDRLLPFHFKFEHLAGKYMGFADYLRRHPNSQPTGENIDENHVINTIAALQFTLHTAHRKSTNQIAIKLKTYNDVINRSNLIKIKHIAFCHLNDINQSPPFAVNKPHNKQLIQRHIIQNKFVSNFKLNPLFSNKMHITTRNNPELNIFSANQKNDTGDPTRRKQNNKT